MRSRLIVALLLLVAFMGMASAASDSANASVSVTISSVTWINIDPDVVSWTGVNPGTQTGVATGGYYAIEIENIGSQNITKVWANATFENARPWGTGDPAAYNAGNFILLTANQSDSTLYFVNRIEFNESGTLVYLKDPTGALPPSHYSYGRIRNASNEYFWMIDNAAGCNGVAPPSLLIGTVPHNRQQSGTTDFSGAGVTTVGLTQVNVGGTNWGVGNINAGAFAGYCAAIDGACGRLWIYHWNMDAPGAGTASCTNAKYLKSANGISEGSLAPGAYFAANITLRVPYGVALGTINGVLTILASDV